MIEDCVGGHLPRCCEVRVVFSALAHAQLFINLEALR